MTLSPEATSGLLNYFYFADYYRIFSPEGFASIGAGAVLV
jgi:hypothetical protein